jgi:hypothetical protein
VSTVCEVGDARPSAFMAIAGWDVGFFMVSPLRRG